MKHILIPVLLLIAVPAYGDDKPSRKLRARSAPQFGTLGTSGKWNGSISVNSTPCPPDGPAIHTTLGFNNFKTPDEAMAQVSVQLEQIEQEAELIKSSCKKTNYTPSASNTLSRPTATGELEVS